ncbi:hypothetical protein EST38_g5847 [Candolleomyces aberdarensis]|uniref:Uncharacterized protein n=1 Tax=Candolleomyces aberdarensis TaxID=2316362 RepID=A0A4Q2DJC8_9AGAR|nr:hypothetical protein EST38_g5847 [Candolleomyces aberdarensis]
MSSPPEPTQCGCTITPAQITRLLRGRVFEVAPRSHMRHTSKEIYELIIHSQDVFSSLAIAARLLCKLAVHEIEYTRTVAYVASIIYGLLGNEEENLAWHFRFELGERVVEELTRAWTLPWTRPQKYIDTQDYLPQISGALADFYAVDLVPFQAFQDAIENVVNHFTQRNHLLSLLIVFSRANSHLGKKMPHTFYQDVMWEIRLRCQDYFGDIEGPQWQEKALLCLFHGLIRDAEDNPSSIANTLPCSYIYSGDLDVDVILSVAQGEIEELDFLDIRSREITKAVTSPISVPSGTTLDYPDVPAWTTTDDDPVWHSAVYDEETMELQESKTLSIEMIDNAAVTMSAAQRTTIPNYPDVPAWATTDDDPVWDCSAYEEENTDPGVTKTLGTIDMKEGVPSSTSTSSRTAIKSPELPAWATTDVSHTWRSSVYDELPKSEVSYTDAAQTAILQTRVMSSEELDGGRYSDYVAQDLFELVA